jgi:hypothetical protein
MKQTNAKEIIPPDFRCCYCIHGCLRFENKQVAVVLAYSNT